MSTSIRFRPATCDDLPVVLKLYAQPDFDDGQVLPIGQAERLLGRFSAYPDYTLYVAERDVDVVGSFALLIMDNLGHRGAPSGIIEDVVVAPQWHGRGIGRAMMDFAHARCREKHCYKIVLSSNTKRERAHAFYQSLGFVRHGYSFSAELTPASPRLVSS
jgi:GNAT superfamily N-acetyltransferase